MNEKVRKITGLGIFAAIVIVLQVSSALVRFGPIQVTLALIPIVIGAIIYGPLGGLFLGFVCGLIIIFNPETQSTFMLYNPLVTVFLCLFKTGIAGFVAGLIPKLLKKHQKTAVILSSILTPIINTGIFAIVCILVFMPMFNNPTIPYFFLSIIGINFVFEFAINAILSPTIFYIIKVVKTRNIKFD